ncbi:hypothetical protein BST61_g2636 [Cercospora zeina]
MSTDDGCLLAYPQQVDAADRAATHCYHSFLLPTCHTLTFLTHECSICCHQDTPHPNTESLPTPVPPIHAPIIHTPITEKNFNQPTSSLAHGSPRKRKLIQAPSSVVVSIRVARDHRSERADSRTRLGCSGINSLAPKSIKRAQNERRRGPGKDSSSPLSDSDSNDTNSSSADDSSRRREGGGARRKERS